jgi:hypothetical protein
LQETLEDVQAAVAKYIADAARAITTLEQLVAGKLAAALVGANGVDVGLEEATASKIMAAGGVRVQHVFPWLWAGEAVTSKPSLRGVATGELIDFKQSGLQVRSGKTVA